MKALLALLLALSGVEGLLAQAKDRPEQGLGAEPGKPAPAFQLKTRDGKAEVTLDTLKGKPALLIFGSYT